MDVSTIKGMLFALTVPISGIDTCISESSSSRNASNSSSDLSISSISSTTGSSDLMDFSSGLSNRYSSPKSDLVSSSLSMLPILTCMDRSCF